MRKWIVLITLIFLAVLAYNFIYQNHRDIESEKAEFVLTSIDISNEFTINASDSENKYLNKTLEINGTITELNEYDLTLDNKIFCQFKSKIGVVTSKKVSIKGRFIGYDELLEQVKLDQCNILTK